MPPTPRASKDRPAARSDDGSTAIAPMEAKLAAALPEDAGWQFEPKWDGFRAIATREDTNVDLRSRSGKPLGRYFPDIVGLLADLPGDGFTLDGELVIPVGDALSFAALQARLHPAASRVERLAREAPALLILFDCLRLGTTDLARAPLHERRTALETFHAGVARPNLLLSPRSLDRADAVRWLDQAGGALDGVMAKRLDEPYRPGERAMIKVKRLRTADCVVGGFRPAASGKGIGSLLLGLYGRDGRLDHVGFTGAFPAGERTAIARKLVPFVGPPGFTGDAPGAPSRWSNGKAHEWTPLRPELVVEISYDQVTAGRFRHGTRLVRWRPDKAPEQCTQDQLARELRPDEVVRLIAQHDAG